MFSGISDTLSAVVSFLRRFRIILHYLPFGRVEEWRHTRRSGLSVAPRFLWKCLNNRTVAGFHSPPRRTERADFPHSALLLASQEDLWDVANWKCCRS